MAKLRCFVAMAFGHADIDAVYNKVIKKMLVNSNIVAIRVDRVTHNDRIDFKIRSEIEKADVLIADLTHARPSVYWEAGYGERVRSVIYTCRSDHFKRRSENEDPNESLRVHFDLQNANIIRWTAGNEKDFREKLSARIALVTAPLKAKKRNEDRLARSRSSFAQKSLVERRNIVTHLISRGLAGAGYYLAPKKEREVYSAEFDFDNHPNRYWPIGYLREKMVAGTLLRLFVLFPQVKLEEKSLRDLLIGDFSKYKSREGKLSGDFEIWEELPSHIRNKTRRRIKAVRNVWLLSTLDKIPKQRLQKVLIAYRRLEDSNYFFRPSLNSHDPGYHSSKRDIHLMPTSSEVYLIDEIRSRAELRIRVNIFLQTIETAYKTIVKPKIGTFLRNSAS